MMSGTGGGMLRSPPGCFRDADHNYDTQVNIIEAHLAQSQFTSTGVMSQTEAGDVVDVC